MNRTFGRLGLIFAFFASSAGCVADGPTSLDDCDAICSRYRSCFDSEYPVADCNNRCSAARNDRYFAADTENCRSCFFGRSCNAADYTCSAACDWIVP